MQNRHGAGSGYSQGALIADLDALGEIIEKVKLPTYIMGGSASPVPEELVRAVAPLKNLPIRRGCQHPAKSRGGKLYALLSGGVFPCGNAGPMPERLTRNHKEK